MGRAATQRAGRAAPQVRANNERALHQRPQRKVRALLGLAQPVAHRPAHLRAARVRSGRGVHAQAAGQGGSSGGRAQVAPCCRTASMSASFHLRAASDQMRWRTLRVSTVSAQT